MPQLDNKHESKAKYTSPELKRYGTISELTHGAPDPSIDGGGGSGFDGFESLPPAAKP